MITHIPSSPVGYALFKKWLPRISLSGTDMDGLSKTLYEAVMSAREDIDAGKVKASPDLFPNEVVIGPKNGFEAMQHGPKKLLGEADFLKNCPLFFMMYGFFITHNSLVEAFKEEGIKPAFNGFFFPVTIIREDGTVVSRDYHAMYVEKGPWEERGPGLNVNFEDRGGSVREDGSPGFKLDDAGTGGELRSRCFVQRKDFEGDFWLPRAGEMVFQLYFSARAKAVFDKVKEPTKSYRKRKLAKIYNSIDDLPLYPVTTPIKGDTPPNFVKGVEIVGYSRPLKDGEKVPAGWEIGTYMDVKAWHAFGASHSF